MRTAECHEEQFAIGQVGSPSLQGPGRREGIAQGIALGVVDNVGGYPRGQGLGAFLHSMLHLGREFFQVGQPRAELLAGNARRIEVTVKELLLVLGQGLTEFGVEVAKVAAQHGKGEVAQVFVGKGAEKLERGTVRLFGEQGVEVAPVAARLDNQRTDFLKRQLLTLAPTEGGNGVGEGVHIGGAQGILLGQPSGVAGGSGLGNQRQAGRSLGRRDVQLLGERLATATGEFHHNAFRPGAAFLKAIGICLRSPRHKVAQAGEDGCLPLGIGARTLHGVQLGIVVHLELYHCTGTRFALRIDHGNGGAGGAGVVRRDVDFREAGVGGHDVLLPPVTAKDLGVHQHSA